MLVLYCGNLSRYTESIKCFNREKKKIDTKAQRVLFAEADKKVIDFLFSLLVLPIGSVIELISKKNMVGCIGNLHGSIENISATYIQPNFDKNYLLKPKSVLSSGNIPLLPSSVTETVRTANVIPKYYKCSYNRYSACHDYVTTSHGVGCPLCSHSMTSEVNYVTGPNDTPKTIPGKGEGGYVKEVVTYMVSDDLVVMPMSTISTITLFNRFNVESFGFLEEKNVKFGMEEGLELLKASLQSKKALTKVFLSKKTDPDTMQ
ncbi:hypothetical protein ACHQM5_021558 [Ranunculus cassubicifolius]